MADKSDHYLGNPGVKRHGVKHSFTSAELAEYIKCQNDTYYFIQNYVKIISLDDGLVNFKLYDYQKELIKAFEENRFNVVLACRQSGKSITVCAYILWYALFHTEKLVAVLANKGATSKEMLSRITLMLENIPFFLQPGCKALNKGSIEFSNNTKIEAHSTSASSIRGKSVSFLYLDEFAFVENDYEFYRSTYPVITAGTTTKVVVTSTANGIDNKFYELYQGAIQGTSGYVASRVDWWDVPGRDETWKADTIANTSLDSFLQEYGNDFGKTGFKGLIDPEFLQRLRAKLPVDEKRGAKIYTRPQPDHNYVAVVDTSKGRHADYSTVSVIDLSTTPFEQVATFRDNTISPLIFPEVIYHLAKYYHNAYLIVESNDQGSMVYKTLRYEYEYEHMYVSQVRKGQAFGMDMTSKTKRIGCSNLKDFIEKWKLLVVDPDTIEEMTFFEEHKDSYAAREGHHDDMVMGLVMFGAFANENMFQYLNDTTFRDMLVEERERIIKESVPFTGGLGNMDSGEDEDVELILTLDQPYGSNLPIRFKKDPFFGIVLDSGN